MIPPWAMPSQPWKRSGSASSVQHRSPSTLFGRVRYFKFKDWSLDGRAMNLYDLEHIEQNHEAYAQQHAVVAASAVTRLVKTPARDVVAVEE